MYFTIQKLVFDSSDCNTKSNISRYIFDSFNYSVKFIDTLCAHNFTNRCIRQDNNSYITLCNNLSYIPDNPYNPINTDYQDDVCIIKILLIFLIITLLFIFYKGCFQESIDNSCGKFRDKIIGIKISKPCFRFHNRNNNYSEI